MKKQYPGKNYWMDEEAQEVITPSIRMRWFPKAGKLQVSHYDIRDSDDEARSRAITTMDVHDVSRSLDAVAIVQQFLDRVNETSRSSTTSDETEQDVIQRMREFTTKMRDRRQQQEGERQA